MIGKNISQLLFEQQKTQVWLAQKCGVTKGHINQIITGKTQPSLQLLLKISESLSVSIDKIVDTNSQQS